ncbi:MAG: DPP IV N-terminal domain-containing protein [Gemmataceae bacterium]
MRIVIAIAVWSLLVPSLRAAEPRQKPGSRRPAGAIAFASLAPRGWDVYVADMTTRETRRLTDHPALDYNAVFAPDGRRIAFVSERDGNMELYVMSADGSELKRLTDEFALDDHPAWSPDGKRLAFVSTRQPAEQPGQAWNAVYVMRADGSGVQRVTPAGVADYSPSWSPRGDFLAVASGNGKPGEADLYVMKPDGSDRRKVIADGGWPTFAADGKSLYFHSTRQGKWGVWQVGVDGSGLRRITAEDVEAYTPRVSADGNWLAMAVKRGSHRQIELLDLRSGKTVTVTQGDADHWNPSPSPDGRFVVYHRISPGLTIPNVEPWGAPPDSDLQMLRLAGSFPAFSPDGKRLALVSGNFSQLDVMNIDGSARQMLYATKRRSLFSTTWAHTGDRIAFAHGPAFGEPQVGVNIVSVRPDGSDPRLLTEETGNNGFPAYSPDGKQLVFRSGRDGQKNLYIMDADGGNVRRLTEGKWTDTMADWSPAGDWIVFSSNRGGNFEIYLIRPDGTGLRKLIGGGGRHNHPHFSPDGQWIVFTSQRAGFSAEEISLPFQFQPYGSLFAIRLDGSGLLRLTHNGFEEGTPAWSPARKIKPSQEGSKGEGREY